MTFIQLVQVMAASCLLTIASMLMLRRFRHHLTRWLEQQLPPRHLKFRGVRRRVPAAPVVNDADEPS
ncbi:cellulose biosynthesis protein BcsF [Pseudomonas triticifolii]|uniref:Cellulose biosynthesis protein BcsF n=1 Tax=Pseudomonas triticifolii TaxID=2762592 RepID=A0ABR7BID9_9PSED|nr:cellulose biosynthesis protein BcsF [Pseudomonas triticifolii]MBC3956918.1 cellulose biosynthesis protein BcsF [Pseudomonas triticifolii]